MKSKPKKSKEWSYNIDIKFGGAGVTGATKEEALKKIKESFYQDHGIKLEDYEITNLEVLGN